MEQSDVGLVGLAVMGENLALNLEDKGFRVTVFNRSVQRVRDFISTRAKGKRIAGAESLAQLAGSLKRPRKVILMVRAGQPVDDVLKSLSAVLQGGDIVIDGGNSHYRDTRRRAEAAASLGLRYLGAGVSGGEEGALRGPSIMPGGDQSAWEECRNILEAVAARGEDGSPCAAYIGPEGSGHFVKMVHNGIEYGDMQLIAEAYGMMRDILDMPAASIAAVFAEWNKTELNSYLMEISAEILAIRDADGAPLADKILDTAGQKGTGKWSVNAALELGTPLPLISEAVFMRCLSARKEERVASARLTNLPRSRFHGNKEAFLEQIRQALYASKIVSYAQGFDLLAAAAREYGWKLDYGRIAMLWTGGCIIRSGFLVKIRRAFEDGPVANLLTAPYFAEEIGKIRTAWRNVAATALLHGVSLPAMVSALCYYDACRAERLPANLIQAQRDYFGAHTFERTDRPRGEFFHADWTGRGGKTSSTAYNA